MPLFMKESKWKQLGASKLIVRGFEDRLSNAIERKGTSIKRLARDLACDDQLLRAMVAGELFPDLEMIIKLSIELDISIDYLLRYDPSMVRDPELEKYKTALEKQMVIRNIIVGLLTDVELNGAKDINKTLLKRTTLNITFIKRKIAAIFGE